MPTVSSAQDINSCDKQYIHIQKLSESDVLFRRQMCLKWNCGFYHECGELTKGYNTERNKVIRSSGSSAQASACCRLICVTLLSSCSHVLKTKGAFFVILKIYHCGFIQMKNIWATSSYQTALVRPVTTTWHSLFSFWAFAWRKIALKVTHTPNQLTDALSISASAEETYIHICTEYTNQISCMTVLTTHLIQSFHNHICIGALRAGPVLNDMLSLLCKRLTDQVLSPIKIKAQDTCLSAATRVRLKNSSALQHPNWEPIGIS